MKRSIAFAFLCTIQAGICCAADGLRLAEDGRSGYVIYCDAGASASVQEAAKEVQRVLKLCTGAELPISRRPADRMISLGENEASSAAGVVLRVDAPDDSFRLRSVGRSIFIVGKDSPDEPRPQPGWASRGTLYGAYEFLEMLGVRWLLPGDWGEDIPRSTTLTAPRLDIEQGPAFFSRVLEDVQDRRPPGDKQPSAPKLWLQRQKTPSTLDGWKLSAGHAWDDYITPEQAAEHPEWLAKDGAGNPRRFARHSAVKFCTSEPALVEAFAESVIRSLDKHPERRCASISPSDGGDFCQCAKCQSLVAPDPHGKPSYSALILRFYRDMARRVAEVHPDRLVCGLVYYNYMYPPQRPLEQLPGNLWLSWAPLNYYGWGLAKPVYRDELPGIAAGWRAVTPNLVYHNYSTWMRSFNGAPVPPALEILKLEVPAVHQAGARGVDMVGLGAWGYGAPTNYILAKQMWDPRLDVDRLYREWLQRAYGPGWESMDKLYRMIEGRMMARKAKESPVYRGQNYEVNHELLAEVHAPVFGEIERLYLEAMAKTATEAQRRRLEMFGENLVVLCHDLRQAGLLAAAEESVFYRDDEAYRKFLADTEFSIALYRNSGRRDIVPIWKGEYRGP
ncbi:MAG: DUF4838 domain-containing protein [Pirellulales bacterium]|nr:DUF4838 domain-containing protein [Pirellulales bacterium]